MRFPAILCLFAAAAAAAQQAASLPSDPKAIIQALRDANGLSLQPIVPWHLQLSWDQFDSDGDNAHSGTIEEFYVGPKRYRIAFKGDSFSETEIATTSGLYLSTPGDWPPIPALEALEFVATPLHRFDNEPSGVRLQNSTRQFTSATLPCIKALPPGYIAISSPAYCFGPGNLQLRFAAAPALDAILYNKLVTFQNRFVGQQISASVGGRKILEVRVDKLEALPSPDEGLFAADPGQLPISGRIKIPSSLLVVEKRGEMETTPGQQGKATVQFVVGKDGRVISDQAISGPTDIQKVAIRAIRQYRFRPFLILDQPIEVEGTMEFSVN
jgi:Gram-negative bacterial TonB protein C-terminal